MVQHDPIDDLDRSGVSMKPDKVVGISINSRYQNSIASLDADMMHAPIKGAGLIYPFLVLEAKRELKAPGFRSIELQTAFPVRRFLTMQSELRRVSDDELDPMVWFFAFQGEDWRLYGAVLEKTEKVVT